MDATRKMLEKSWWLDMVEDGKRKKTEVLQKNNVGDKWWFYKWKHIQN